MASPIFIFSLPRAGSTLLQRLLMGHVRIASVAEPWLLLPICIGLKDNGILAEYSHSNYRIAIMDFMNSLPNKNQDYYDEAARFATALYSKLCNNNESYFIDKTPRYYLIIDEIHKMFPDGKFIFLFRNPVSVLASMLTTWTGGRLNRLFAWNSDLLRGPALLSKAYSRMAQISYGLNYERLVVEPEKCLHEICDYLELAYEDSMLKGFSVRNLHGRMGDVVGRNKYDEINVASCDQWKLLITSKVRKQCLIRYVSRIDGADLKLQGYEKSALLYDIRDVASPRKIGFLDMLDLLYSVLVLWLKPNIWRREKRWAWSAKRFIS